MKKYDSHQFVRNKEAVANTLYDKNNQLLCKQNIRIQIPKRYFQTKMASIGEVVNTIGIIPLILDSHQYATYRVPTFMRLTPDYTDDITVDDIPYLECYYSKDTPLLEQLDLDKRDDFIYNIYNEFIINGKVPWFLEYDDLLCLFDHAKYYTGASVGEQAESNELIAANITRQPNNRSEYYRLAIKSIQDKNKLKPSYIGLKSVFYAVKSPVNKLAGNYFDDGIISAIVNPTDQAEHIEKLLRA